MDVSEITRLPLIPRSEAPTVALMAVQDPGPEPRAGVAAAAPDAYQQCDECGAPVDRDQRYCVKCGARRRTVNDPAARYFSQASARSKVLGSAAGGAAPRPVPRGRGLGTALAIAIVPVAVAAGMMLGRSSSNEDSQLIQALAHRQSAIVGTAPAASVGSGSSASTTGPGAKRSSRSGKSSSSTSKHGKTGSKTGSGTAQQLTGSKPTAAQKQQGAAVTQQVQKSTGKTYVQTQQGLPGIVVVP